MALVLGRTTDSVLKYQHNPLAMKRALVELLRESLEVPSSRNDQDFMLGCYHHCFAQFYLLAKGFSGGETQPKDLLHDILLKIVDKKHLLPTKSEEELQRYLHRLAYHHCLDHAKRRKKGHSIFARVSERHHPLFRSQDEMERATQYQIDFQYFSRNLSPVDEKILQFSWEGYKYEEISDRCGLSERAVANRLYRIKNRIRHFWQEYK